MAYTNHGAPYNFGEILKGQFPDAKDNGGWVEYIAFVRDECKSSVLFKPISRLLIAPYVFVFQFCVQR